MKLADKQKWFWEQCGFETIEYLDTDGKVCGVHYAHPKAIGGGCSVYPPIDLNNLFKYAVPEDCQQIIFQTGHYCGLVVNDVLIESTGGTEALALYGAICGFLGVRNDTN